MVDLDLERWHRLQRAEADEADNGPTFIQVQEAAARRAQARDQLTRFRAQGPQGHASGPPLARAHAGERILPGVGGHDHNDIDRVFQRSVHELEARVAAAESEHQRLSDRRSQCAERLATLRRLVEACRTWANEQGVVLPGDDGRIVPPPGLPGARSVHIAGPLPGTPDFLGRPA
jgi:hypothetical protein